MEQNTLALDPGPPPVQPHVRAEPPEAAALAPPEANAPAHDALAPPAWAPTSARLPGMSPLTAAEAAVWDRGTPQLVIRVHGDRPLEMQPRYAELQALVRGRVLSDLEGSQAYSR